MADSPPTTTNRRDKSVIQTAHVVANRRLCRDHYRLTLRVASLPPARPGQFVHLCPDSYNAEDHDASDERSRKDWVGAFHLPMLRRAFSIAGLGRSRDGVDVDVIYRVVGAATGWMETLREGDPVSLLGPLGNGFPISDRKSVSWLVAGGVGLPPMLWLAEALHKTDKCVVAFCGAQTHDLLALTLDPAAPPDASAKTATPSAKEFAQWGANVVLSTDDGSLGFRGYIGSAMAAYHQVNPVAADALVVYTCGPEPMMRFVAEYCLARQIECYVCVERNMACGTGMCQSCVVPIRDANDPAGWSYRLCCTDGPIFEARTIVWETPR
jgi:dihydroorotate dehydrogenase electron transfer subunit